MNLDEKFMYSAIESCKKGLENGETPFGAAIVKNGQIIVSTHNRVWSECNITSHAEIVAIREACKVLNTVDLSGCTIYSTCEPCPMCFSAIHWAKIEKIVYGASIEDAQNSGFNELDISNEVMKREGNSPLLIQKDTLKAECKELFQIFNISENKKVY